MKKRIEKILANSATSDEARDYLIGKIQDHGNPGSTFDEALDKFIMRFGDTEFGINVIRSDDGSSSVVYGAINYLNRVYRKANCDLDTILKIMVSGDSVPDWWNVRRTAVACYENGGYGYRTQSEIDGYSFY